VAELRGSGLNRTIRPVEDPSSVIGRDAELAALNQFLGAERASPAALVLEGEVGIGKTTLWGAGIEMASPSYRVLAARASASEADFPFGKLAELLDEWAEVVLPKLPLPQCYALEVALLLAEPGEHGPHPQTIATGFLGAIRLLAAESALLLALDDVQWVDRPSRRALEFLVRRLKGEPVKFLLAGRDVGDGSGSFDLVRALSGERVTRLRVGPLSLGALHELLHSRLGLAFPRPTLRRIAEASGGNPFFALEIARSVSTRHGDVDPGEPLPVPKTLHDVVSDRLEGLPVAAREALLIVALAADPTVQLIRTALPGDPWERLRPALQLEAVELNGDRIRFTHPLLASATEAGADLGLRRDAHRRLAGIVPEPEERARHLARATYAPDEAVAAEVERGATRALARGAPDVAAGLLEAAGRLTPADRPDVAIRRTLAAAMNHVYAGTLDRAENLLERLMAETSLGPPRAAVLVRLASVHFMRGRGIAASIHELERALIEAGHEPQLQLEIERSLVWMQQSAGDVHAAYGHAAAAAQLAEALDERALLAGSLAALAYMRFIAGRGLDIELIERAVSLEPERTSFVARPAWIYGMLLEWAGEHQHARSVLERLERDSHERGDDIEIPLVLSHMARLALRAGDFLRARQIATECLEYTMQMEFEEEQTFALATAALVEAHLGEVQATRELTRQGLALAEQTGVGTVRYQLLAIGGFLDLSVGDAAAAHHRLAPLIEALAAAGFGEPAVFRIEPDEIEALIALGRTEEAKAVLDKLAAHARAVPTPWTVAVVARARGMLEAASGDAPRAVTTLEDASDKAARLGEPFELGRALLALGAVQRRAKRWADARRSLKEAKRTFERVGARLWLERAEEELGRVPGRRPGGEALTPTERRVAELVVEGRPNKEVAAALFVTVKAIEANLSRIYAKLGVRSRGELARRLGGEGDPKL
jgi:DNA-binding CsgD family transcriptional regulator